MTRRNLGAKGCRRLVSFPFIPFHVHFISSHFSSFLSQPRSFPLHGVHFPLLPFPVQTPDRFSFPPLKCLAVSLPSSTIPFSLCISVCFPLHVSFIEPHQRQGAPPPREFDEQAPAGPKQVDSLACQVVGFGATENRCRLRVMGLHKSSLWELVGSSARVCGGHPTNLFCCVHFSGCGKIDIK